MLPAMATAEYLTEVLRRSGALVIWWGNLERVISAVDDLACRDLLG